jgi:hypothetical protein
MLLAGAWLLSTPGISRAGGLFFPHHHGQTTTTTTTSRTTGSAVLVTPASTFMTTSVVPASTFVNVVPASTFSVVPASSFVNVTSASSFVNVVPASSFVNVTPASTFASPFSALAAPASAPALNTSYAMAASINQASAASAFETQAAVSSYPSLAQAAQTRGIDGGKFVVFIRNFARTVVAGLGGQAAVKANVKTLLTDLIGTHLGPLTTPVVGEVDKLLGEIFGTTDLSTTPPPVTSDSGQCFTIRVCIDGTKVTGNVVAPPVVPTTVGPVTPTGPGGKLPSMAPLMSIPSGQSPARFDEDKAPPAPPVPVPAEAPANPTPKLPSVSTPPPERAEASDTQHREVMSALNGINETLKKLVK